MKPRPSCRRDIAFGNGSETLQLPLNLGGVEQIIRIQKLDILSPGQAKPVVARRRSAGVGLRDHLHSASDIALSQSQAVVAGTVVHENDFEVHADLTQCGIQGRGQPRGCIVAGNEDADFRRVQGTRASGV